MADGLIIRRGGKVDIEITGQEVITGKYIETISKFDTTKSSLVLATEDTPNLDVTVTKLNNPDVLPGATVLGCSFSPNAKHLVIGGESQGARLYSRTGDNFTFVTGISGFSGGNQYKGPIFSPDGTFIANPSNGIFIFSFNESTSEITPITIVNTTGNPSITPGFNVQGSAAGFSKDNNYCAVAHNSTPFPARGFTIFKKTENDFEQLPNPAVLPPGVGNDISFSVNKVVSKFETQTGDILVVGSSASPFITIYQQVGDTFTKLANPNITPTHSAQRVALSPSADYLMSASNNDQRAPIYAYKRVNDTYVRLDDFFNRGPNKLGIKWSSDENFVIVGTNNFFDKYIEIYKRDEDTFNKLLSSPEEGTVLSELTLTDTGRSGDIASVPEEGVSYLAWGHNGAPHISLFKTTNTPGNPSFFEIEKVFNTITLETQNLGYALEDGTANETKTMMSLFREEE